MLDQIEWDTAEIIYGERYMLSLHGDAIVATPISDAEFYAEGHGG